MKRKSASLVITETQLKSRNKRPLHTHPGMVITKKTTTKLGKDVGASEPSHTADGDRKQSRFCESRVTIPQKARITTGHSNSAQDHQKHMFT